jgi:hypothetical protein
MLRSSLRLACLALSCLSLLACNMEVRDGSAVDDPSGDQAATAAGIDLLFESFDDLQTEDPRDIELPSMLSVEDDEVVIDPNALLITAGAELGVAELPDVIVLGFENLTGFDIYVTYRTDGEPQSTYVFAGETLLLEYPCLSDVQLVSEEDFDPLTGFRVWSFALDSVFLNPVDFLCGDALLLTFDPEAVSATVERIDLLP